MTKRIKTESGSVYELDHTQKRVRRLSGVRAPTARQHADGLWRTYDMIGRVRIGGSLLICWADESVGPAAAPGAFPGTVTSPVVEVTELDP
jgi:hypothetical protein